MVILIETKMINYEFLQMRSEARNLFEDLNLLLEPRGVGGIGVGAIGLGAI